MPPIDPPEVEVDLRYTHLTLTVPIDERAAGAHPVTVGGALLAIASALPNKISRALRGGAVAPRTLKLLDDVSGSVLPGRLTLVLGAPGSGKSSLLKALTGRLANPAALQGEVRYGGLTRAEAAAAGIEVGQLVQYVNQLDEHAPLLTVRETLTFVARNALAAGGGGGIRDGDGAGSVEKRVDEVLGLLHLGSCADTLVGDDLNRGISGGERKRLTVGEGLLTNARLLALDEASTGLDASVTLQIFTALRERAVARRIGIIASLLQPTPEVVALFDDVILLRDGATVFHGPRTALPGYLEGLGFLPPAAWTLHGCGDDVEQESAAAAAAGSDLDDLAASDLADWISEWVTYPLRRHRKDLRRCSGGNAEAAAVPLPPLPPVTTPALVAAWAAHPLSSALLAQPRGPRLTLRSEFDVAQYSRRHVHHPCVHVGLLARRQAVLLLRAWDYLAFRLCTALLMGALIGTLYWQSGVERGLNYYGLFLNTIMLLSFFNLPEMSPLAALRFIAYRQADNGSYPAWAFPFAAFLLHLGLALAETLLFTGPAYFMAGLTLDAPRFALFALVAYLGHVLTGATFRAFAFVSPTLDIAQTAPMSVIAVLVLFAGFFVPPSAMGWSLPIYYIDVYGYATKALAINEFTAPRYAVLPASGGDKTLGRIYLDDFGLPSDATWLWGSVAFLLGYAALIVGASIAAFVFVRFDRNIGSARTVDGDADDPSVLTMGAPADPQEISTTTPSGAVLFPTEEPQELRVPLTRSAGDAATDASALTFNPVVIAFRDLRYTVRLSRAAAAAHGSTSRELLRGICGFAEPGRMLALMGASGAGKTTLLDVLAGRKNSGSLSGCIFVNGRPRDPATFNRIAAYCEQADMHMPLATVREAFEDAAALRLCEGSGPQQQRVSAAARRAFVNSLLGLLELRHLAHRKVGDPGSTDGLAPGERKRLTIGVELCANTPALFLDEPTSGLDSRAAAVVLRVLRRVASTGRTVICTIHQPSYDLFSQFDDLLLLQRGGWQVYSGPLGRGCRSLITHLEAFPGVPLCPLGSNPAGWMLDVLAGAAAAHAGAAASAESAGEATPLLLTPLPRWSSAGLPSGEEFQRAYFSSARWIGDEGVGGAEVKAEAGGLQRRLQQLCELQLEPQGDQLRKDSPGSNGGLVQGRRRGCCAQYSTLAAREWRSAYRDVPYNMGRILALVGLQVFYGLAYLGIAQRATDVAGLQSLVSAIFNTTAYAGFVHLNLGLPVAVRNRAVFYRETAALMYDSWAYFLALLTAEVPWLTLSLLTGPVASYFMIGLGTNAVEFFTSFLALFTLSLLFVLIAKTAATALPSFELAQSVTGVVMPILMDFSGLYGKVSAMPTPARVINWVDPLAYALNVLIPVHLTCTGGLPAGCPTVLYPEPGVGPVPVDRTQLVDELYGVSQAALWKNMGYLGVFVAAFLVSTALSMQFVRHIVR